MQLLAELSVFHFTPINDTLKKQLNGVSFFQLQMGETLNSDSIYTQ